MVKSEVKSLFQLSGQRLDEALAYNLLRALMARTAQMTGQTPRELSFRAARQTLRDFHMILLECR